MDNLHSTYFWHRRFRDIWETAAQLYKAGERNTASFLGQHDVEWLGRIGCSTQEMYDFAEDRCADSEPDYETAILVTATRRDYFLTVLKGEPAGDPEPEATLPPREDELGGIAWLPRIIEKAKRKLSDDVMFCCGGDRDFLRNHGIHPAEFLCIVWTHWKDERRILAYVRDWRERQQT